MVNAIHTFIYVMSYIELINAKTVRLYMVSFLNTVSID